MSILFYLSMAMLAGLLMTRVVKPLHLPNVTAYLIAGVLIGPYVFSLLNKENVESLSIITEVALGFIAFSIGDEFKLSDIAKVGKNMFVITMFEALMATLLVDIVLLVMGYPAALVLPLGAIASSTAPAATLLLVRQYKADGPLTRTMLPVVALDDAVGLIVYSISVSIAQSVENGNGFDIMNTLVNPVLEIVLSLVIGFVLGLLLSSASLIFKSHGNRMSIAIALVFLGTAIADYFDLSALLLCMMIGATYINLRNDAERILGYVDEWTTPLFMLFFVISGAELDLTAIPAIGLVGVVYIILRFAGKWAGSFLGGKLTRADEKVTKYLGFTMMPQAGVAIGMASMVVNQLPDYGTQIQTIVLAATLFYEFVGPLCAKYALVKAGEIKQA